MTVAELIVELQRFPGHVTVHVERIETGADGMCVETVTSPADAVEPGGQPYGAVIKGLE